MVKVRKPVPLSIDGAINIDQWLQSINTHSALVRSACVLAQLAGEGITVEHGLSCFQQSLGIAEKIAELNLGEDAIAAALVYPAAEYAELTGEDIQEQLGSNVAALVSSLERLHNISNLQKRSTNSHKQIDGIRKMLLSMIKDVRVVVIKLAEKLCAMRAIAHLNDDSQRLLAQEIMDIYAPLASRLGIHEIKWELEDIAFGILQPEIYQQIAKNLQERRIDREARVQFTLNKLNTELRKINIAADIQGRAKHIYSIHRKMQRKKVPFSEIYDALAFRVLVPTLQDCYSVLSTVHDLWKSIPEEFDDYVSTPKENGYQSIHTAVIDKDKKHFEVQIRTFKMHEESEMGVAAHWMYKEGSKASGYEEKIKWLRQLLDWQKDVSEDKKLPDELEKNIFEDRIYVFTPGGEIVDLPQGATSLDFAYLIHTEIGHRCRGAKVRGKIVTLTTPLKMGDTIEILTTKESRPSRDWLIPKRGYLKTPRARAKVLTWFKKQDMERHIEEGRDMLEREIKRLNLDEPNLDKLAHQLSYKNVNSMLSSLGNGDLRLAQIVGHLKKPEPTPPITKITSAPTIKNKRMTGSDVSIYGVGDLLTHIANCCKPVPGDPITGYITQGNGITIHHQNCKNIEYLIDHHSNRIVEVEWISKTRRSYASGISVQAYDRPGLVSDVAQILSHEKISIRHFATNTDRTSQKALLDIVIDINDLNELGRILDKIAALPNVISAKRKKSPGER
jgi:GTP pyrophosphokinase